MGKTSQKEKASSGKTVTKRMHTVTAAYLSSFIATDQPQKDSLWAFDKLTQKVRLQPIKDTSVVRRFYEFDLPDGTKDASLEAQFSRIESKAIPIIKRWCKEGAIPTVAEIPDAATFVACLFVRVPRSVEVIRALTAAYASATMEFLASDDEKLRSAHAWLKEQRKVEESFSFQDLKDLVTNFDAKFAVETDAKYALVESIGQFDAVQKNLIEMYWCLRDSRPFNGRFMTSDAPVNAFFYRNGKAGFGGGLGLHDVEVNLPLSPYVCLSLNRMTNAKTRKADASFTREVNRRTAHQAEQYIYSSINTKLVASIVAEGSMTAKRPKIAVDEVKERTLRDLRKGR